MKGDKGTAHRIARLEKLLCSFDIAGQFICRWPSLNWNISIYFYTRSDLDLLTQRCAEFAGTLIGFDDYVSRLPPFAASSFKYLGPYQKSCPDTSLSVWRERRGC
jgi:hypothetical protein